MHKGAIYFILSVYGHVESYCEHDCGGNKKWLWTLWFLKFLDLLNDCQLQKKDSAPWSELLTVLSHVQILSCVTIQLLQYVFSCGLYWLRMLACAVAYLVTYSLTHSPTHPLIHSFFLSFFLSFRSFLLTLLTYQDIILK
jgi:hypothetical protein